MFLYFLLIILLSQNVSQVQVQLVVECARERNCCRVACPKGDSSKCDSHNSIVIRTEAGSFMIDAECTMANESYGDNTEEECLERNPSKTQSNTFDVNHLPFKLLAFSALVDQIQIVGLELHYPYSQFRKLAYSIKGDRDTNVNCVIVKAAPQIQTQMSNSPPLGRKFYSTLPPSGRPARHTMIIIRDLFMICGKKKNVVDEKSDAFFHPTAVFYSYTLIMGSLT